MYIHVHCILDCWGEKVPKTCLSRLRSRGTVLYSSCGSYKYLRTERTDKGILIHYIVILYLQCVSAGVMVRFAFCCYSCSLTHALYQ